MGADATVDHGPFGLRQILGQAADGGRRDATEVRHRLGGEAGHGRLHLAEAVAGLPHRLRDPEGEQMADHGGQQGGIGAGADRHVLVGQAGGAGTPGIDHHQPSAPLPQGGDPPRPVGSGGEAPVRLDRVGPQHQEVIGAVDVGHGDGGGMSEHVAAGDVLGHLVDGGRREDVGGADGFDQGPHGEAVVEGMDVGVTEVDGDRLPATRRHHLGEAPVDEGERLLP